MNIFAVDKSPLLCARALDDKRLIKMILETAQILCTVVNEVEGEQVTQYKSSHINHPITQWATDSRNFNWLCLLGHEYGVEYEYRFNKKHASMEVIDQIEMAMLVTLVEHKLPQPLYPHSWYNGASHSGLGISFERIADVHLAYRLYLNARWPGDSRRPKWTRRSPPKWAVLPK